MFADIGLVTLLTAMVPLLVNYYIPSSLFRSSIRVILIAFGVLFVTASLGLTDMLIALLRTSRADDGYHSMCGTEIALALSVGDWGYLWDYPSLGNKAFHIWIGVLYWLTGCGLTGAEAFNGFAAFWANLMLIRHFASALTLRQSTPTWLPFMVFAPRPFFWFTILYKEAIIYWGVCLFYTSAMRSTTLKDFVRRGIPGVLGIAVGLLFRPYLTIIWVVAVSYAFVFLRRSLLQSAVAIVMLIAAFAAVEDQIGVANTSEALEYLENQAASYERYAAEEGYASNVDVSNPVPGVVGAISLFLRPFPWNLRAARVILASLEIWIITGMILAGWAMLRPADRRALLSRRDVITSLLACAGFCLLFSYILNEGQIIRFRIHALPALLTLAWLPLSVGINRKAARLGFALHRAPYIPAPLAVNAGPVGEQMGAALRRLPASPPRYPR
ncbi:MAG: hypothetical protein ACP5M0_15640 [Desulfomonilaceae bacterium]